MMEKWRTRAAIAGAAALLMALTGCGQTTGDGAVGTWGKDAQGKPHLVLADDGSLSGSDGCNRLVGSWEQEGDTLTFGKVASTMKACEGVDAWLANLASATVSGDTLTVLDKAGAEIGTLERS